MTFLDRWLQQQRINKVLPFIPEKALLLDIGCHQGELFVALGDKLQKGWGLDPLLTVIIKQDHYELLPGIFPDNWQIPENPNCITMLAVLEHIPRQLQSSFAARCASILAENGRLIITVPSAKTDGILKILLRVGLIKGMSLEEHYGFDPETTRTIFESAGLKLIKHHRFQFGLNNLFVFQKKV